MSELPVGLFPPQLLPQQTPLFGRQTELAEIVRLLADPACRLLNVTGPGGIGKTRLALETASLVGERYADGVWFVPLQAVQSLDSLAGALGEALALPNPKQAESPTRLVHQLHNKELLLVLDNFEQLLAAGGAEWIAELLSATTLLQILVTSREVLNVQQEWLLPLHGLAYPLAEADLPVAADKPQAPLEAYGAVQLFVARARRVQPQFSLGDEAEGVTCICQLVQGMPLALELAASWVKSLSCAEIASEIGRNLDFLASNLRNVPERHRSMEALFDCSWQQLTPAEQSVFARLSVFCAGFTRLAAEAVAGASLALLSTFVDKSLLRWVGNGRYQVHELLRQYAAEKLAATAADNHATRVRHASYYANLLHQRSAGIMSEGQAAVLVELATDVENVQAAWAWLVAQADAPQLAQAAYTLYHFYNLQGRFRQGITAFEEAIAQLESCTADSAQDRAVRGQTLALLCGLLGRMYPRLGRFAPSFAVLERSCQLYQELALNPPSGSATDPWLGLALLANVQGNYTEGWRLAEAVRQRQEASGNLLDLFDALYALEDAALMLGDYGACRRYTEQAYALAEAAGNRWQMGVMRREMGRIAHGEGHYSQARQHLQAAFALMQTNNDPEAMAVVLNHLGKTAWAEGAYADAEEFYSRSLTLYRELDDRGGLAMALVGMGATLLRQGAVPRSHPFLRMALLIAIEINWPRLTGEVLAALSDLLQQLGYPERSVTLCTWVLQDAGTMYETKARARGQLDALAATLSAAQMAAATQQAVTSDWAQMLPLLSTELFALAEAAEPEPRAAASPSILLPSPPQPLVEPLTGRELEVLHLIADGLSNQQIADKLIISLGTVKFYASQIYGKLGVNSRVQAIVQARELALLN